MNTNQSFLENCVELSPNNDAQATVIWLHGLGADGNDFVPIVPEMKLPSSSHVRFIFPHAPVMPVTINSGYAMRAWFDIYDITAEAQIDETGISNSVARINYLVQQEEERGIPADKIFLAGFSQGAVIALTTGLCYSKPLAGIIALSGYLPRPEKILLQASSANHAIPIFIAHGTQDTVVPYTLGQSTYMALKQAGYRVIWHSYSMPHSVCGEEIHDISGWIQEILAN